MIVCGAANTELRFRTGRDGTCENKKDFCGAQFRELKFFQRVRECRIHQPWRSSHAFQTPARWTACLRDDCPGSRAVQPACFRQLRRPQRPPLLPPLRSLRAAAWRSSKLIGLNVYNDQNEKLGDISEILLDKSGKVEGIVIGVGGFLGMGQHDIKVDMAKLKFVDEPVRTSATTTTTTTGAANPTSPGGHHHHHDDALEVVSGSCDPEWRYARISSRACRSSSSTKRRQIEEKAPVLPGLFLFTISVASMAGAQSVFSAGNAGQEPT